MSEAYRQKSKNCVLVKDDVGKAKPSVYDLPHQAHSYGRSEIPDAEGAREVTMHWASHVPRRKPGPDCQDFRKLNRKAAQSGVTNAIQLKEYRQHNDEKLIPPGPVGCLPKVIPSDVIPSFAYGRKSRPSTPIASIVGGHYALEHEEVMEFNYKKHEEDRGTPTGRRVVKLTKAARQQIANAKSERALQEADTEPKELFKLSKFKKVESKLTFPGGLSKSASMPNL